MHKWSWTTRTYILLAHLAGIAVWYHAIGHWEDTRMAQFVLYLCFSAASSSLKAALPGIKGSLSVNFVFILLAALDLSLPQTMAVAAAGTVTQCALGTRTRPRFVQISFNLFCVSTCAWVTFFALHSTALKSLESSETMMLFWGSVTYYLVNTFTVSGVIASTERRSVLSVWKDGFFWTGPQYLFGGALAGAMHMANRQFGWQYAVLVLPAVYLLYRSYQLYLSRLEEEKKHVQEVADLHLRTIESLALAIEAKDETTHAHLRRVQIYAMGIGNDLALSKIEMQALEAAALLHDIGKLAVPEYILSKPGRLTPEEFEKIKIHPVAGANILAQVNFPYPVAAVVLAHHEKWDGTGYPDGLAGEAIPLAARILSAVDVLDALASDRQYRRALPLEQAVKEVCALSGTSFDPVVVERLSQNYLKYESIVLREVAAGKAVERTTFTRGVPAAGFAEPANGAEVECQPCRTTDFISLIAAARQEFQLLHEVTRDLGNSLSVEETLSLLALRLKPLVPYHAIAIYCLKDEKLIPQFVSGTNANLFQGLAIPLGEGLSGWVAEKRKPVLNGNPAVEAGYTRDERKFSLLQSGLAIPLQSPTDVVGVLALYHQDQDAFTKDHLRILLAIGSKAALTIENALEYGAAKKNAETDPLTGLLNAKAMFLGLDAEIQHCQERSASLAVLVLDLDGFKQINDRHGHLAGNDVLVELSKQLRRMCRKSDLLSRMGGDEFVAVCPDMDRSMAYARAEAFESIVAEVGRSVCGSETLSVSVGFAVLGEDGEDAAELLAAADDRMYTAKRAHHEQASQLAAGD
ncbi:MAG: diguanylate cyclase [Bryobacterales bacterium]|nr:diguanylate cyclase [Bryobacterales bacterium]